MDIVSFRQVLSGAPEQLDAAHAHVDGMLTELETNARSNALSATDLQALRREFAASDRLTTDARARIDRAFAQLIADLPSSAEAQRTHQQAGPQSGVGAFAGLLLQRQLHTAVAKPNEADFVRQERETLARRTIAGCLESANQHGFLDARNASPIADEVVAALRVLPDSYADSLQTLVSNATIPGGYANNAAAVAARALKSFNEERGAGRLAVVALKAKLGVDSIDQPVAVKGRGDLANAVARELRGQGVAVTMFAPIVATHAIPGIVVDIASPKLFTAS